MFGSVVENERLVIYCSPLTMKYQEGEQIAAKYLAEKYRNVQLANN